MMAVHLTSLMIGIIGGLCIGMGVAFYATWSVERQDERERGNQWSRGWDMGWESRGEHDELMQLKKGGGKT